MVRLCIARCQISPGGRDRRRRLVPTTSRRGGAHGRGRSAR